MSNVPLLLDPRLATWAEGAFDREGKIVRGLAELGPIQDRDVVLAGEVPAWLVAALEHAGTRIVAGSAAVLAAGGPDVGAVDPDVRTGVADVVLGAWSAFRGIDDDEISAAVALLRTDGRLLIVHDYGRDDIEKLAGDRPETVSWNRHPGPFTAAGFKIRVLHCWWTFASIDEAAAFLGEAFGEAGTAFATGLRRARLSHNVAIYHRDLPTT